jgi:guanylate kinase
LTKRLLSKYGEKFVLIPSYTTRAPYPNEENSSYHFVSEKEFEKIIETEVLIAVTKRNKILYGSSLELIEATMENNRVGICNVEIEVIF